MYDVRTVSTSRDAAQVGDAVIYLQLQIREYRCIPYSSKISILLE